MTTVVMKPDYKAIKKWLESVVNDPQARRRVLIKATVELKDRASAYPKAGPWNREPGTDGHGIWYQRLWGTRWRNKDGTLGGVNSSEQLQRSWKVDISSDVYTASVFTGVSYAPYLFDPAERVNWAEAHGWQTIDEIAQDYAGRFVDIVEDEIDRQIAKPI